MMGEVSSFLLFSLATTFNPPYALHTNSELHLAPSKREGANGFSCWRAKRDCSRCLPTEKQGLGKETRREKALRDRVQKVEPPIDNRVQKVGHQSRGESRGRPHATSNCMRLIKKEFRRVHRPIFQSAQKSASNLVELIAHRARRCSIAQRKMPRYEP